MTWVFDGQKVLFLWEWRWVPCVVACAMGNTARVVNPLLNIDTREDVDQLKEIEHVNEESVAGEKGVLHPVES